MSFELTFSIVFFGLMTLLCAWYLKKTASWAMFWRGKEPVMLEVVDERVITTHYREGGSIYSSKSEWLVYEALDGPLKGKTHMSSLSTTPQILQIGDQVEGYCDRLTGRMESKKALWFLFGTYAIAGLICGWLWLQSLRWLLFEIFTRGTL